MTLGKLSALRQQAAAEVSLPLCAVCCEVLGKYGGPVALPCGHNGCRECLAGVQKQPVVCCPLCRSPFDPRHPLLPNTELRDLIALASTMVLDESERRDGWEAFPDRARTAEEYATELKLGTRLPNAHQPSAPMAPEPPGAAAAQQHRQVMELTPPQWLPDSMATVCGGCHKPFRALTRLRHHCRCCGRIFCGGCSAQRALLPPKFNTRMPERVCDTCAAMLTPVQPFLAGTHATAAQPPVHDAVLDSVSLRAWLNAPYCASLEQDVFKAANVLAKFTQVSRLQPELGVPAAVLAGACGLMVMSLVKVGAGWSATFGTGVVVARNSAGQWSAPCAVALAGLGWGLQVGGELTDLLLVLRTPDAVRACCGMVHLGLGGSVGMALGPLGRTADASFMVGSAALTRPGAAYAYSCSQGAFFGVSLEGSVITVRDSVNHAFYGLPVTARALLLERTVGPPPAAAALYDALHGLMRKYEVKHVAPTLAGTSATTSSLASWATSLLPSASAAAVPISAPAHSTSLAATTSTRHPGTHHEGEEEQEAHGSSEQQQVAGSAGSATTTAANANANLGLHALLSLPSPPRAGAAWLAPHGGHSSASWGGAGAGSSALPHQAQGEAPSLGASTAGHAVAGARALAPRGGPARRAAREEEEEEEEEPMAFALFD